MFLNIGRPKNKEKRLNAEHFQIGRSKNKEKRILLL
jgi:hypothetical protein